MACKVPFYWVLVSEVCWVTWLIVSFLKTSLQSQTGDLAWTALLEKLTYFRPCWHSIYSMRSSHSASLWKHEPLIGPHTKTSVIPVRSSWCERGIKIKVWFDLPVRWWAGILIFPKLLWSKTQMQCLPHRLPWGAVRRCKWYVHRALHIVQ